MSHEVETMMYAGELPWHRLGTKVAGLTTAEEAIKAAELDWEVELHDLFIHNGGPTQVEGYSAIARKFDHRVYGVVGNRYVPIQNREAFSFFDQVIGTGQAVYETAGALFSGRRIWILANLKDSVGIKGDEVKRYLVLVNSHDGSLALQMFWSPIRVVCNNTLSMALSRAGQGFYTRHTSGAKARIDVAQEILGMSQKFYKEWTEKAERLTEKQFKPGKEAIEKFLLTTFGYPLGTPFDKIYPPIAEQMDKVVSLIELDHHEFAPVLQGTNYEAFNAVAKFADHYRPYRGSTEDTRLAGAMFGTGMAMKNRAWEYLLKA